MTSSRAGDSKKKKKKKERKKGGVGVRTWKRKENEVKRWETKFREREKTGTRRVYGTSTTSGGGGSSRVRPLFFTTPASVGTLPYVVL